MKRTLLLLLALAVGVKLGIYVRDRRLEELIGKWNVEEDLNAHGEE